MRRFTIWMLLVAIVTLLISHTSVAIAQTRPKPRVLLIGTGGTIAGVARSPEGAIYDAGKLTVAAILEAIPEVAQDIEIEGRQLADPESVTAGNPNGYVSVASSLIRERHWLILSRAIEGALERDGFDAVIVTHGTDSLDETAFFLQLTLRTLKPVFVVGAMRPSQGNTDPDGPDNLRSAFRLILDKNTRGKGVLVVSQFLALPAWDVLKARTYPSNLPIRSDKLPVPFEAPNFGVIASIEKTKESYKNWRVTWNQSNRLLGDDRKALQIKFDVSKLSSLPEVPVLTQEVGNHAAELIRDYYLSSKPQVKSFVLVGQGNCALTQDTRDYVGSLASRGDLVFVRSSRTPETNCHLKRDDLWPNVFGAATLTPQHLKILMQLLQANFESTGSPPTAFRESVSEYFNRWIPYPYGISP